MPLMVQEKQAGKVAEAWAAALESRGMLAVDIAAGIAETLGVKDAVEIMNIKKAALLAAKTAKVSLTPKIEGEPLLLPPALHPNIKFQVLGCISDCNWV